MTRIEQIEADIQTLQEVIDDANLVLQATKSINGKRLLKSFAEGKDAAAKLTINANETLQKQGILGVQAHAWIEQHIEYKRQIADQAQMQIDMLRDELLNPEPEVEAESNTSYEG